MKWIRTNRLFVTRWLSGLSLSMALLTMISLGLGCHSHEDSATMKEARALNEETQALARQLETRLDVISDDLTARMQQASQSTSAEHSAEHAAEFVEHADGSGALRWAENLQTIESLGERLAAWSANQVLLPGQTCNHDHGDGHAHNHGTAMNDLSDEDHLELQRAIRAELDAMIAELDKLTP